MQQRHNVQTEYGKAARRVVAVLLVALLSSVPAAAQEKPAVLRFEPAALEIRTGETTTLSIALANARDAFAIDVRLTFNPKVIEVVDADANAEGMQVTPGTFLRPDFVARNAADNATGAVRYAITQVNPSEPATGSGVVFTIEVRGKAAGDTALTLRAVELADGQGRLLPVALQNGTVRVTATQASAVPSPSPTLSSPITAVPTADGAGTPAVESPGAAAARTPGSPGAPSRTLPCAGALLLPVVGLIGLVGRGVTRPGRR